MPFRQAFDCLWCGRPWQTRSERDLEGWALLCPECLGRADENGFLRLRLRTGLRDRAASATSEPAASAAPTGSAASPASAGPTGSDAHSGPAGRPEGWEDWYLRRGHFARGPIHDGAWSMELEQVTRWLDGVPMRGAIVELGAAEGWWSGLLAEKGELWVYDADADSIEAARRRLTAHGLLAHLHRRDPLAEPDKQVDAVFSAYLLASAIDDQALAGRLALVRRWLGPGGLFAFVEVAPVDGGPPVASPGGTLHPRRTETLDAAILGAGFASTEVVAVGRSFIVGQARLPQAGVGRTDVGGPGVGRPEGTP